MIPFDIFEVRVPQRLNFYVHCHSIPEVYYKTGGMGRMVAPDILLRWVESAQLCSNTRSAHKSRTPPSVGRCRAVGKLDAMASGSSLAPPAERSKCSHSRRSLERSQRKKAA